MIVGRKNFANRSNKYTQRNGYAKIAPRNFYVKIT